MQHILIFAARWLHRVALALWLGGLIAIGALVAPTAFHILPHDPALAEPSSAAACASSTSSASSAAP